MKVLKLNIEHKANDYRVGKIQWIPVTVVFFNFAGAISISRSPEYPFTQIDLGAQTDQGAVMRVFETPEEILAQIAEWEKPQPKTTNLRFVPGRVSVSPEIEEPEFCGHAAPRAIWAGEEKPAEAETGQPVG